MNTPEIDPVKYGVLWQKVQDYERRFDDMGRKMDRMEEQLEKLVALANQGRGGFWVGMREPFELEGSLMMARSPLTLQRSVLRRGHWKMHGATGGVPLLSVGLNPAGGGNGLNGRARHCQAVESIQR